MVFHLGNGHFKVSIGIYTSEYRYQQKNNKECQYDIISNRLCKRTQLANNLLKVYNSVTDEYDLDL